MPSKEFLWSSIEPVRIPNYHRRWASLVAHVYEWLETNGYVTSFTDGRGSTELHGRLLTLLSSAQDPALWTLMKQRHYMHNLDR